MLKKYLSECVAHIEIKENQILRGLGEVVDGGNEKKQDLSRETLFVILEGSDRIYRVN
ncbi:MAG: hypothetical protein PF572_06465 [Patescibacteria group bacterium]|nr:hypothetical protein [Patescibacteria group bacterium]